MRKTIAALTIGVLIIGGAAVAAAQTDEPDDSTDQPITQDVRHPARGALLLDVLGDLVERDVIDQGQADAIVDALRAKRDEIRGHREELRAMMEEFWEDDVLTADEIAQLPDWHPFRQDDGPLADQLADGELTREELREARAELGHHRRGHGPGPFAPPAGDA